MRNTAINMDEMLNQVIGLIEASHWNNAKQTTAQFADIIDTQAETMRSAIMADMATGKLDIPRGTEQLEAVRWLRRGSAHIARILAHLGDVQSD